MSISTHDLWILSVYCVVFYVSIYRVLQVLAHRGNHWTVLLHVCQTIWDQSHRITTVAEKAVKPESLSHVIAEQMHTIFTPLLVLAADLIMDMLTTLDVSVTCCLF